MKSCAMGAMLFGGTLGVAQEAQAGLTWTGVRASAYNYTQFETADQRDLNFGTPVFTAGSNFIGFSAATENGWSITASNAGGDELYATNVNNYFTVSSATTVTISGIGFGNTGGAGFFRLLSMTTPQVMLWSNATSPDSTIEVTGA